MTALLQVEDRYLGDGVYASFDGYHIILDLRGQDDFTRIVLEKGVLAELVRYETDVRKRLFLQANNTPAEETDHDRT